MMWRTIILQVVLWATIAAGNSVDEGIDKTKDMIMEKVFSVQCETEFNQTKKKDLSASKKGLDALS